MGTQASKDRYFNPNDMPIFCPIRNKFIETSVCAFLKCELLKKVDVDDEFVGNLEQYHWYCSHPEVDDYVWCEPQP